MQRMTAHLLIRVDLTSSSSAVRVCARLSQTPTDPSEIFIDLHLLNTPGRSSPPTLAVHGLALVWLRFGAAVAGRATVTPW
jgi:hypothetical protein